MIGCIVICDAQCGGSIFNGWKNCLNRSNDYNWSNRLVSETMLWSYKLINTDISHGYKVSPLLAFWHNLFWFGTIFIRYNFAPLDHLEQFCTICFVLILYNSEALGLHGLAPSGTICMTCTFVWKARMENVDLCRQMRMQTFIKKAQSNVKELDVLAQVLADLWNHPCS